MIISSQEVYKRLVSRSPKRSLLSFEVLALCCLQDDGETLDLEKMKRLIKLLRPDRDGKICSCKPGQKYLFSKSILSRFFRSFAILQKRQTHDA